MTHSAAYLNLDSEAIVLEEGHEARVEPMFDYLRH